jgi:uncharacterized protein
MRNVHMNQLVRFRKEKDNFFIRDDQSPLTRGQKQKFQELAYFSENPSLSLKVTLVEFPGKEVVNIQTSTGYMQTYQKIGSFNFPVERQDTSLSLYANDQGFFLPFVDSLAGGETYGAGRYVEAHSMGDGEFVLDFNFAYNPYCAYNDKWSCPLTPAENRLGVPIATGEMVFEGY